MRSGRPPGTLVLVGTTDTHRSIDPMPTQEEGRTMSKPTTTTTRIVATAALGGSMIAACITSAVTRIAGSAARRATADDAPCPAG